MGTCPLQLWIMNIFNGSRYQYEPFKEGDIIAAGTRVALLGSALTLWLHGVPAGMGDRGQLHGVSGDTS